MFGNFYLFFCYLWTPFVIKILLFTNTSYFSKNWLNKFCVIFKI